MKAFLAVFDLIPRWVFPALLAAAVSLYVVTEIKLVGTRLDLSRSEAKVVTLNTAIDEANARAALQKYALESNVLKAKNEATIREAHLRTAIASAQSESDGMRDDLTTLRGELSQLSRDAAVERATAVSVVLAECSAKYTGLAAKADRHVSDLQTMISAWPRD